MKSPGRNMSTLVNEPVNAQKNEARKKYCRFKMVSDLSITKIQTSYLNL
ncbi:MAG: hypothetical protein RL711_1397 [Bacteroidota bacterium]